MKELLLSLFGAYSPVMTQVYITTQDADLGAVTQSYDVVASGMAGVDWPWLLGVALFALVLWSLFRLLGVFFK